ncbi:hypothetical protein NQ318_023587 [Aromia moschata]|uniref:Uncharacterized protein n=1 Tax=Aromia moschata TaxID=1265417 RepID=A0AAV8YR42_9CUCU|nr:hypothetical protein NQ318_023587 [Aromia moschata]
MTDEGFIKVQSDNLPRVGFMVKIHGDKFHKKHGFFSLGEVRGVKADKSGRHSYGDAAVGWVQVRRENNTCTIRAKITPEHNVKKKQYAISCNINEEQENVIDVKCHDCLVSSDM